jgi:hypothetical protein
VLAPPAENAVSDRLTDAMLARALTDEALTRKLVDDMIADAAQETRKKPKAYPAAIIPFAHGLGAMVTFSLAVVTAAGMR